MSEVEWQVASGRKSRRPRVSKNIPSTPTTSTTSLLNLEPIVVRIRKLADSLSHTVFYRKLSHSIEHWLTTLPPDQRSVVAIVAYGIGKTSTSLASQIQLACLVSLLNDFSPRLGATSYEPAADVNDLAVCARLHITNVTTNEECRHPTTAGPTLFFMPHCAHRMYSNVLWSNWNVDLITNVCILGNSFSKYGMALRKEDASNCIAALSAYTTEVQLHDALCSEEENIQVLVHNVTIEQLYSAFTDTSTMFYATNDVPDMNKHGIMDNQPPANPLKAATTVWDQEMVRGSASQVETTEKATEEKLEKK